MSKILMVTERYMPIWGGAENQLRQLIPHLRQKGHDIAVVTRRWNGGMARRDTVDGVTVLRLGIPGESNFATLIFICHLMLILLIIGRKYDVFHSHGVVKMGVLCRLASYFCSAKTVVKIATAGKISVLPNSIVGRLMLALFRKVDTVVCMTDEIYSELMSVSFPKARIARIPNAVDCARFKVDRREDRRTAFREKFGLDGDAQLVFYSGRLVYRKGLDLLIAAWAKKLGTVPGLFLMLLGSGKGQPDSIELELQKDIAARGVDNILFVGETDRPEEFLANCDLFVFPSRREGFPNALMEAMASELPVVASAIGGNVDLVEDGKTGLLYELEDEQALSACLEKLLTDKNGAAELSGRARAAMLQNFDFPSVASKYDAVYRGERT